MILMTLRENLDCDFENKIFILGIVSWDWNSIGNK